MKKTLLTIITLFIIGSTVHAQVDRSNIKAGLIAGIPVGDAADISSFSIGFDFAYHVGVSELLDLGAATGFINSFGETRTISGGGITVETEFEDFQFIPLAASLRIYPTYQFKLGADAGYAVGVNEGNDGGFYLRPLIGYNITGNTELNVSYVNISNDGGDFSIAMAGILFLF
ncbi:hypothetical protein [Flagellimonas nanhaiensis]|uniref:Outer membrane protein beta-barrel domain-containing protein n=1 Tax=Flagellimonas nanhaiensis TaxID=2292706 RepID=A0A371JMF6_9FLAO|nr:hypothetical protein [Allomuricauda nanhaiensis]RDY58321.1 hypothetical protein DX873_15015 [Allomuricauda nanhaiensis]